MATSETSLIIVGGGITGLCLAVAAQAKGLKVQVIARDNTGETASGIAAGMIAPALEGLLEFEPEVAYARLHRAQQAWVDLMEVWPADVRAALEKTRGEAHSRYVWYQSDNLSDITTPRLKAMGVPFAALTDEQLKGIAGDMDGVEVAGDWLLSGQAVLESLKAHVLGHGGELVTAPVAAVSATTVTLATGEVLAAGHVAVAAGFGARALASSVPSLGVLEPVKGHLLDLPGQGGQGVVRWAGGYLADHVAMAKFGATMQFGQDDLAIEPEVVADLKARATGMMPSVDLSGATPKTGVRASTPDSWPLIGRDATGVYVAVGMRRNGYVFAPYAARLLLALIAGEAPDADAALYDPNRF
ncbi:MULTISPECIES: FAD-binding oxidoreductase [Asticcacaulis]|uniref:NAD(P)/FAD-dependent oxidoreductase n=1 Tax=Asticcacaulis TaxID=76890 RepID=UPI001AE8EED0|nr:MULTISPECIES: FAD-dependent oxidoreductase [Asticcacaulis]MBP2160693.1 glycine oxidase [Asticcacaulis solisilvae]MDR6801738.1 glycine oxidase [Asticcacaulis sp. BE141]